MLMNELPDWLDIDVEKHHGGGLSALKAFIHNHEPTSLEDSKEFRDQLHQLLVEAMMASLDVLRQTAAGPWFSPGQAEHHIDQALKLLGCRPPVEAEAGETSRVLLLVLEWPRKALAEFLESQDIVVLPDESATDLAYQIDFFARRGRIMESDIKDFARRDD